MVKLHQAFGDMVTQLQVSRPFTRVHYLVAVLSTVFKKFPECKGPRRVGTMGISLTTGALTCVCLCTAQPFAKWSAAETFDENRLAFATPTSAIISSAEASERREAQRARLCETLRSKSEEVRASIPPLRRTLLAGGRAGPRRPFVGPPEQVLWHDGRCWLRRRQKRRR